MDTRSVASRSCKCLFVALALASWFQAGQEAQGEPVLVPRGAGWRYLDNGSNQGTNWQELWYDDDAWGFGHAELGYGDAVDGRPETTIISSGPDPDEPTITTYFRRFFYVSDVTAFTNVILRLLRDDGGIVYLNGIEAFRSGMPDGPVDYQTLAAWPGASGADERRYFTGSIDPGLLVNGINLLAVEIHQVDFASDDLSFDLELVANVDPTAEPVTLVRGPYLQSGTTTNLIVRWRTLEEVESRVQFGLTDGALDWEVFDPLLTSEHVVTLTNLAPDTKYYYAIGTSRVTLAGGADYHFVTAPLAGKPTRIWAMGDSGTAAVGGQAVQMRDAYYAYAGSRPTDLWLLLGDNAYYCGTDSEYQAAIFDVFQLMLRQTVAWSTIGNHETYGPQINGQFAYFQIFSMPTGGEAGGVPSGTENYYSFNYGNIHFVCLDSELSGRQPGTPMLVWLQEDLAANTSDWTIAFWHSPPYSKGSHDSDNLFDNFGNLTDMRANIVPILESYGVDLVLCGHSHNYERSYLLNGHYGFSTSLTPSMILDAGSGRPDDTGAYLKPSTGPVANLGTVYIVAGSSGWATFPTGRHPAIYTQILRVGSMVIDINGNRLDAKFLRETGAIDDYFTILKGAPAEPVRFATFRIGEGQVSAWWKSLRGRTYRVEKATNLQHPDWVPVSNDIQATGATTSWSDFAAPGADICFFRVVQLD